MSDSEKGIGNGISLAAARKRGLRLGVILFPVLVFGFLVLMGFLDASAFTGFLWDLFLKIMVNFGWLIDPGCLGFVLFMVILIATPLGNIKFGGKNAKPEYDRWNWWAISLCAGIGTGIVLWGPVEPLWLAMEPAKGTGLLPLRARCCGPWKRVSSIGPLPPMPFILPLRWLRPMCFST
jgi:choline-glycine betaine transporter